MSLQDIRSECSDFASLLQPYVDAELENDDQERVAGHLQSCKGCASAVTEQAWVRQMLQSMERERAPQALRAKILLGLDEVERESAPVAAAKPRGLWDRLRDLGLGSMVMIPAGALAVGVFFFARMGVLPGDTALEDAPVTVASADADLLSALAALEPQVGFPVRVARTDVSQNVELVSAKLDRAGTANRPGARLEYRLVDPAGKATGQRVVDIQTPGEALSPGGKTQEFRGRTYQLARDADGSPQVGFALAGVTHHLTLVGQTARPPAPLRELTGQDRDFSTLLMVAHALAEAAPQ